MPTTTHRGPTSDLPPAARRPRVASAAHQRQRSPLVFAVLLSALAVLPPQKALAVARRAFMTSTQYDGNLAALPVAGATVLDKADNICRLHAAAVPGGGLPNAQTYRAWLSTSTTDAYCHVQGLSGKKSNGCDGASQPGAGPWYQVNGATAFTDSLERLTGPDRAILRNLLWNELGQAPVFGDHLVWTGTDPAGVATTSTCSNWSSAAQMGSTGLTFTTAFSWTRDTARACDEEQSLICLEPGASDPFLPFWTGGALVFVTATPHDGGALGSWLGAGGHIGLAAGDAVCQAEAAAAGLPGPESFVAWLSTAQVDAKDRLTTNGPFKRVDGFAVANNVADLVDGATQVSIHVTAAGEYLEQPRDALTGTLADGTWSGADCTSWTSASAGLDATIGKPQWSRLPYWTDIFDTACSDSELRLYCFANAITLFWDGFESGNASRWSSTLP